MEEKICNKCNVLKTEECFYKYISHNKIHFRKTCKECIKKLYFGQRAHEARRRTKEWIENNSERAKETHKKYYEKNKEKLKQRARDHYYRNRENVLETVKKYRENNREKVLKGKREGFRRNRDRYREFARRYNRERKKIDISYRLKCRISNSIWYGLRRSNGGKKGGSILKFLPYTMKQLKEHLESQFESWMTWDNWGQPTEHQKTWHIDHIIPLKLLPHDSMDHPNFKLAWSLNNLRPLDSLENIKKGCKIDVF